MNVIEILNIVKTFGSLGLFFVIWYYDKKAMEKNADDLKEELKVSNSKWYDLVQKLERHIIANTGALKETESALQGTRDRLDVLLRRGDKRGDKR